ncbi:MAG: NAD-dependent epimerase/dehydratase family protein [Candidatus Woesearchaeota archaeon]
MKILLTGGTGFLGGDFLEIEAKKHEIFSSYRNHVGKEFEKVKWIKLNLIYEDDFEKAYDQLRDVGIEAVVHIGGASPNRAYIDGGYDATIKGTKNLLNLAKKLSVQKFVFISSICVEFSQKGPYAESKIIAEKMVKDSELNYSILRPGAIIGKNSTDLCRVSKILSKVKYFPIVGKGDAIERPIYSNDLVKIIDFCITNHETDFNTYPTVGPVAISRKDFFKLIASVNKNKVVFLPIPSFLAKISAYFIERLFPTLGVTTERINIALSSVNPDLDKMKIFNFKYASLDKMFSELSVYL